ncbi:peptide-methionine (S)-S-oxide reductase MsrA [Methanomassiliicoccales archaeon LGM-RCC1]|nr:peptide-methionine (S)-S-oxide reductase MsrA [Methanomassiliicoccales archaeon LGM-RCC1]
MKEIYLAGGCFWGVEKAMSLLKGVVGTECGYSNGDPHLTPDYLLVCSGRYGYAETVRVVYDESIVALDRILQAFFMIIDPTKLNRQGNDRGIQYRTGIYWTDEQTGEEVSRKVASIAEHYSEFYTEVLPLQNFTRAEENHQNYLDRTPNGYCHISPQIMAEIAKM